LHYAASSECIREKSRAFICQQVHRHYVCHFHETAAVAHSQNLKSAIRAPQFALLAVYLRAASVFPIGLGLFIICARTEIKHICMIWYNTPATVAQHELTRLLAPGQTR